MVRLLFFVLLPLCLCAQKPYFQQEVNYTIEARLDDSLHTLEGHVAFQYINHSPDTLRELRVHLWGNAFKNRRSAFCRQKLRDGDAAFYFAEEHELGGYKKPDFQANGKKINWKYDPKNPDIARLTLTDALLPGDQVHISTPFLLRIPASFSRLGHVETSYQMTQWYPKPAVYDHKGWHDMPYLDIGEFYSEFGSFDVTLTLPENYVVGATGVLQTPSEIAFLHQKERETRRLLDSLPHHVAAPFPPSSQTLKTIRYTAEKVHDFAWFADKRFLVLKDTARLASGKTVDCWAMFPMAKETVLKRGQSRLWEKGAFYVRRAVEFYSEKVGEYPYPQATAVHSALSAGGGMEYPMITVIGNASSAKDLDDVITHEVGHNWFYGILASHERRHPFMDEGLNTYYQIRYIRQYYGEYQPVDFPKFLLNEQKQGSLLENGYLLLARDHKDTPPDSHSDLFTPIAYGLQVYMKPALCMHWLEQAVGTEKLDAAMQAYYAKWQFRHPYPEDLQAVFQEHNMKADWFFQAMKTKHRTDYRLKKVEKAGTNWALTIQNKGKLDAPYSVSALKNGKPVATKWFEHTDGSEVQKVEMTGVDADAFEVDYPRHTLDINRKNNFRRTSGLFPGLRPIEFRSLAPFQNSRRNTLAALPWVGWNNYDKTMLGIAFYNSPLPLRKLQYYILPGWGLGSGRMTGMARLQMHFFSDGWIKKTTIGAGARMFDFDYNASHDYYLRYWRIAPWVHTELRCGSGSFSHGLLFRTLFIGKEVADFDTSGVFSGKSRENNTIFELRYGGAHRRLPHPFQYQITLETQQYRDVFDRPASYLRGTAEWKQIFYYKQKSKISLRFFAGYFLQNTHRNRDIQTPYNHLTLNPQGFNDYRFDHLFFARSGADNFFGRQVSQSDGGFKGAFGAAFARSAGNSNNFVFAVNLRADLPKRLPLGLPIKPYFDFGYFDDATPLGEGRPSSEQLLWSGGLALEFFKGGLEFYFPLAHSKTLKNLYCEQGGGSNDSALFCGGNYWKMISWSMRLRFVEPMNLVERLAR